MGYVYNNETGNFDYVPDMGGNNSGRDWHPNEDNNSDDIPVALKILFAAIEISANYFAYQIGWGWLCLTIPMTFYFLVPLIEKETEKSVKIRSFIGFVAIMITILAPLPWWTIIIAMVATTILIMDKSKFW